MSIDQCSQELDRILMQLFENYPFEDVRCTTGTLPYRPQPLVEHWNACEDEKREYCFILFRNRLWSSIIRNRSIEETVPSSSSSSSSSTQSIHEQHSNQHTQQTNTVDMRFFEQLHGILDAYTQQTNRRFPIKFIIDLTDIS